MITLDHIVKIVWCKAVSLDLRHTTLLVINDKILKNGTTANI